MRQPNFIPPQRHFKLLLVGQAAPCTELTSINQNLLHRLKKYAQLYKPSRNGQNSKYFGFNPLLIRCLNSHSLLAQKARSSQMTVFHCLMSVSVLPRFAARAVFLQQDRRAAEWGRHAPSAAAAPNRPHSSSGTETRSAGSSCKRSF